jgi:hypothetical protein
MPQAATFQHELPCNDDKYHVPPPLHSLFRVVRLLSEPHQMQLFDSYVRIRFPLTIRMQLTGIYDNASSLAETWILL